MLGEVRIYNERLEPRPAFSYSHYTGKRIRMTLESNHLVKHKLFSCWFNSKSKRCQTGGNARGEAKNGKVLRLARMVSVAVIGVEPAVKYSFVQSGTQTRSQYNAELTLSPRLHAKPLLTAISAIQRVTNIEQHDIHNRQFCTNPQQFTIRKQT